MLAPPLTGSQLAEIVSRLTFCKPALVLTAAALLLAGCDRYLVTVNERPVHTPPVIFTDFELPDKALETCIRQVITDKGITSPGVLTRLTCTNGGIRSVEGITLFSNLQTLNLAHNALTNINPLLYLGNLTDLSLADNPSLSCKDVPELKAQIGGQLHLPDHC